MALTLETGAGVALANSWVSVAEADAAMVSLNNTDWAALTTADKEANLIHGAFYVSNGQIFHYSGNREFLEQGLAWPRTGAAYQNGPAVPSGSIPYDIKRAQVVAASAAMYGVLPGMISSSGGGIAGGSDVKSENLTAMSVEYFDPKRSVGASKTTTASAPLGATALGTLGLPAVVGLVAPLLDEDFYAAAAAVEGAAKIAPIVGLGFTQPAPPQFWLGFMDGPAAFLTPMDNASVTVGTDVLLSPPAPAGLAVTPAATALPDPMHQPTVAKVIASPTVAPRRYGPA